MCCFHKDLTRDCQQIVGAGKLWILRRRTVAVLLAMPYEPRVATKAGHLHG
jgi:hypothetical protein